MSDDDQTKTHDHGSSDGNLKSHHPRQIGKYHVKRVIASGGMGTVFEGKQENPRRSVAIKVIKAGDLSDKAVSRLKYEAQMLARLRHPGIAEIYEAGTYQDRGTEIPFFAMEYIPNARTLTDCANSRKLTVNERLELFLQVCDAVNSGHQRGVVHRDLKPDNILVDAEGRVKIIDFGLAKATDSDLRHTHAQTEIGQIIGSLQYMSPEQFEADSSDLDTRSDVYSLGVVLYELLSGHFPYDMSSKQVYEIASIIREREPRSLSKSGTKVAAEIEIILQKCLRKEREHRYQTAYGLQQDIARYLAGDAIVARSPSLTYQLKVFTRKNKLLVSSLAAAFVLLVVGIIVSTTLLVQVSEESAKARKAHLFLTNIFETAIPTGYGDKVPISRFLDESTKMLDDAFPDDPEIEADVRHTLGTGYFQLSRYEEAREHLNLALALRTANLGDTHPKTRASLTRLKTLSSVTGDFDDYLAICQEIYRIDSLREGESDGTTFSSQLSVIGAHERSGEISEALKLAIATREYCDTEYQGNVKFRSEIDQNLAWLLLQSGDFKKAEEVAREAFETATSKIADGSYAADTKSVLAATLIAEGKLEEAAELYGNFPTYRDLGKADIIQGSFDPDQSDIHLIVFWEYWCPFCDKMMQRAEKLFRSYRNSGIDFVGVTALWGNSKREDCDDFLQKRSISLPIMVESGKAFEHFDGTGVPLIVLVHKGKLIWVNRVPSVDPISRHMLEGIVRELQSSPSATYLDPS